MVVRKVKRNRLWSGTVLVWESPQQKDGVMTCRHGVWAALTACKLGAVFPPTRQRKASLNKELGIWNKELGIQECYTKS